MANEPYGEEPMTILSKFNTRCTRCGGPIREGDPVNWVRGVKGSTHENQAACDLALANTPAPLRSGAHKPIADLLAGAKERGLTFPKVRFLAPDGRGELLLSLAGESSKYTGAVQVKLNGAWIGRIEVNGNVAGRDLTNAPDILATLTRIGEDPARAAAEYGRFTTRCSVCHAKLSDDRTGSSVEMGYGPTCAARFGWPHRPTGARRELAPVPEVLAEMAEDGDLPVVLGGPGENTADDEFLTNELPPAPAPRTPRGRRATQAPLFTE